MPPAERAGVVHALVDHIEANGAALVATMMAEAGQPRMYAEFAQLNSGVSLARGTIDLYLSMAHEEANPVPVDELVRGRVALSIRRHEPIGVVAAITPYNGAIIMAFQKLIPALMAGNSVILRPSPLTPISSLIFGSAADAAGLPPGVLSVVVEGGATGAELLTTDPAVDMVSFTGSTAVGRQILAQAAPTVKRVALELGGKSAQIYLPDAVERAAAGAMAVVAMTAGQACVAATRMLVPRDRKDEVLDAVSAAYSAVTVGAPTDPAAMMGPVISAAQRERCERFVALAEEHGGKVAGGGRPSALERGYYFEPTVLDLPDNANPAAQEEIFGPVIGVLAYDDLDDAVRIANDSVYGLSAQVYGADVAGRDRRGASAPHRRGQRQHQHVQRVRAERWLQAERPRPRARPGRHPRVPRGQAHGDRRAEMTTYDLDWLVSVDDHVIEPPNVWVDRLPAKYRDVAPRMVMTDGGGTWEYDGKRMPTSGLSVAAGKRKEEFSPDPVSFDEMRPGAYDPVARRRHGPGRHPRVAVLPLVSALLRPGLLGGQGQGARAPLRAGLQRLDDRRVVRDGPRPDDPVDHHPAVGPDRGGQGDRALRGEGRGRSLLGEPRAAGPADHPRSGPLLGPGHGRGGRHRDGRVHARRLVVDDAVDLLGRAGARQPDLRCGARRGHDVVVDVQRLLRADARSLKIALSEGNIGWMPYFLERAEQVVDKQRHWISKTTTQWYNENGRSLQADLDRLDVRQTFRDHIFGCFIEETAGLKCLDIIGDDNVMVETDYPHTDTTWPDCIGVARKPRFGPPARDAVQDPARQRRAAVPLHAGGAAGAGACLRRRRRGRSRSTASCAWAAACASCTRRARSRTTTRPRRWSSTPRVTRSTPSATRCRRVPRAH